MARYEDTATPFAEAQFAGVRERKQQEAKKQEKFAKKLAVVQTVAKGANALINSRADALELKQSHKKAYYQNKSKAANSYITAEQARIASKKNVVEYLADASVNNIEAQLELKYPNMDPAILKKHARADAIAMATTEAPNYKKLITQANSIATMTGEDLDAYYEKSANLPRSPIAWLTGKISSRVKKENQDTIEYKAKQQDALYGTGWDTKFGSFADTLRDYEAQSGIGYDLAVSAERIENRIRKNKLYGVVFDHANRIESSETTYNEDRTIATTTTTIDVSYADVKGEKPPESYRLSQTSDELYNAEALSSITDIQILRNTLTANYYNDDTKETVNPRKLFNTIITTTGGSITHASLQKGFKFLSENPDYRVPEFQDMLDKNELFATYKNTMFGMNFGVQDSKGNSIFKENTDKDGNTIYTLRNTAEAREKAREIRLMEDQLQEDLDYSVTQGTGGKSIFEIRKEDENLKTFMADKTKLSDLELDDTQRTALMLAVKPALSGGNIGEFYGVFKDKIEDGINKGNKTISLGPVDLGQFASGRFGTAKITNLYWDTRSNSFVYN